jgi:hypothetical protein
METLRHKIVAGTARRLIVIGHIKDIEVLRVCGNEVGLERKLINVLLHMRTDFRKMSERICGRTQEVRKRHLRNVVVKT